MLALEDIYRSIDHIPGWFGPPEAEMLLKTAKLCPEGAVMVEVGSWAGRSAMMLGIVAREKKGQVWSVDAWSLDTTPHDAEMTAEQALARFESERRRFRLDKIINKIHAESTEAAAIWRKNSTPIDLLHIDGGHLYEEAYADLTEWTPFVKPKGWVCLHDYNDIDECGVKQATLDFFDGKPFVPIIEAHGIFGVWRRTE